MAREAMTFRLTLEARQIIRDLAEKLGVSQAAVVEMSVRSMKEAQMAHIAEFTSVENLSRVKEYLQDGTSEGLGRHEALRMIETIERLRRGIRRLIAYEEATEKWFFRKDEAGLRELEALANNRVQTREIDEGYLSWLSDELKGLSDEEWVIVKEKREG